MESWDTFQSQILIQCLGTASARIVCYKNAFSLSTLFPIHTIIFKEFSFKALKCIKNINTNVMSRNYLQKLHNIYNICGL